MDRTVVEDMAQIPLFQGLSSPDVARLSAVLRSLSIPKDTNLMAVEQLGDTVYAIVRGTVRVQVEQPDGTLVILSFLGAGDTVGEMSLLDSAGRSATVVAMEPCRLLWMDRVTFQAMLESMPRLSISLLRVLSRRLRLANERIQTLATLTVPERVARQLAAFAENYGEAEPDGVRIALRLTQSDLGDIVGASRERVNQVMQDLKHCGLVSESRDHRITVHDRTALLGRYG